MYRFTLSLSDYLDQYSDNRSKQHNNCPICYDDVCTLTDCGEDLKHMLRCYREDLVVRTIALYEKKYGELPELTESFIDCVNMCVTQEMVSYCESGQTLFDL